MKFSALAKAVKHQRKIRRMVGVHLDVMDNAQNFWGSINDADKAAIIENVKKAARFPGPIVEIGALFGLTTQLMAAHKPVEKPLIAVELFCWNPFSISENDHRIFMQRVLYYCIEHCNTNIFDGPNTRFYETYEGQAPSMVFIDASHSYNGVMVDINWARKMSVPIICGHDYCREHPGVVRAVDESFGCRISVSGSVWTAL
jgi:hypothetical protein